MYHIIISFMLGDVIVRSIINTFFNDFFIGIPSSLITIRLNLVSSSSKGLAPIEFSHIRFYFELYALKSLISIVFSIMILF